MKKSLLPGGIFVFGVLVGFCVYQVWQMKQLQKMTTSDEAVMEQLSSMIVLPEELPSIATVTDKEKLGDQPFFQGAENGDKVIIYQGAKRAYLFRPSERKIIDMTVVETAPRPADIPVFQTDESNN